MSWIEERVGTASGVLLLVVAWAVFLMLRWYGLSEVRAARGPDLASLEPLTFVWHDVPSVEHASPLGATVAAVPVQPIH